MASALGSHLPNAVRLRCGGSDGCGRPVDVQPDGAARADGACSQGTQVRAMGSDTSDWVRVECAMPELHGWVRRADMAELRR
jgi:hypothetical protein